MAISFKGMNAWQKRATMSLQFLGVEAPNTFARIHGKFHQDLIHLLLFHETQQVIWEMKMLEYNKQVCLAT